LRPPVRSRDLPVHSPVHLSASRSYSSYCKLDSCRIRTCCSAIHQILIIKLFYKSTNIRAAACLSTSDLFTGRVYFQSQQKGRRSLE
jgi:hypothetical protein